MEPKYLQKLDRYIIIYTRTPTKFKTTPGDGHSSLIVLFLLIIISISIVIVVVVIIIGSST